MMRFPFYNHPYTYVFEMNNTAYHIPNDMIWSVMKEVSMDCATNKLARCNVSDDTSTCYIKQNKKIFYSQLYNIHSYYFYYILVSGHKLIISLTKLKYLTSIV